MAAEATTIARPYAEAVFKRAAETGKLDLWSDMLGFLAAVVHDPAMAGLIANPKLDKARKGDLILEVGGGRLSDEGQNLVKLLADNGRLTVLAEIATLYERLKNEHEGAIDVLVTSAFAVNPAQEQALATALRNKLGREVRITSERDPELIGGVRIRAGDLVIDGSVRGRLSQLANVLGI